MVIFIDNGASSILYCCTIAGAHKRHFRSTYGLLTIVMVIVVKIRELMLSSVLLRSLLRKDSFLMSIYTGGNCEPMEADP